jgi:alkylhydroperoxidase family enzyme
LPPRARALAQLAVTLTGEPWALSGEVVEDVRRHGLDEEEVEAAVGVISMFNYFTRVADATGIEFDYLTPLPTFEPDLRQVTAPRPDRAISSHPNRGFRPRPRHQQLQAAWESWRAYVLETGEPLSRRERRLLASVAAEETADWEGAETLDRRKSLEGNEACLAEFARKLSRQPWRMEAGDLNRLRASGYSEKALLHVISVVAHQNADSRLAIGLRAASRI